VPVSAQSLDWASGRPYIVGATVSRAVMRGNAYTFWRKRAAISGEWPRQGFQSAAPTLRALDRGWGPAGTLVRAKYPRRAAAEA
jgi:hypothetical protein